MTEYRLTARMALSLCVLGGLTAAFVGGIVGISSRVGAVVAPAVFASPAWGARVGALAGLGFVALVVFATLRSGATTVRDHFEVRPVSATTRTDGDVVAVVRRLATQFDVPEPTVLIADSPVPHASVSGFTRRTATLVVSTGLLDRLDRDQLAAVVGHELAHVVNRDAFITSLVATPIIFGRSVMDGLGPDTETDGVPSGLYGNLFGIGAFLLAGTVWLLGRSLLALFARQRELAADRTAARVVGSPAPLVSALTALDAATIDAPPTDLRRARLVSAFSIVESPVPRPEAFTIWSTGRPPLTLRLRDRFVAITDGLFATHPPTEKRAEYLRSYEQR